MTARSIAESWTRALRSRGFDLVQSFDAAAYNRSRHALGNSFRLPTFGRPSPLGLVVAHGAALWHVFVDAVRGSEQLQRAMHPLDEYTEAAITELQHATGSPSAAFFSHRDDPVIPIQRIAEVAGLAGLSPSQLSVHARVGPWLGLRAVVVFAEDHRPEAGPTLSHPCEGCSQPCLSAFEQARAKAAAPWQTWLEVRDSCPVGREARYPEAQIRYHYTKDRACLLADPPPTSRKVGEWP